MRFPFVLPVTSSISVILLHSISMRYDRLRAPFSCDVVNAASGPDLLT
jgi:hypothetical protein